MNNLGMNSRGDRGDGFVPVPVENHEFQFMGSWIPVTPRKPMQGGGLYKDGVVQDPNFTEQREDLLGRNNVASSQAGYTVFDMDDLLETDHMPFSFTSLLSGGDHLFQVPQCGPPPHSRPLYNLNSPPAREEPVGYICDNSSHSVPSRPSLCRTGRENGLLETITTATEQKSDRSMQSVVDSSEVTQQKDGSRQNDLGFDLNKTPQQKPSKKKKKFMPKVFVEGKRIRKPRKPAYQKSVKPKATGSGKRKKAQKTNLKESAANKPVIGGDMSNTSFEFTHKSCRKALSFELEKTGDVGQGDSESEIFQNTSGSNSFTETRDSAGGTSGSCLDSVTQVYQTIGLVATNQPLEASTGVKLPRGPEVNRTQILARDQQPELFIGNQQLQLPMGNQQAWFKMKNQLLGFPVGNQQPRLAMGNHQPMYLMETPRPALASGNQQPGGLQGNNQRIYLNQQTQQTCLPAGDQQYGSPSGMQQLVMSSRGQHHGMLLDNQKSQFLMRNQQPGSSMRGQQPYVPLMNNQHGIPKGFTHLNQLVATCMSSPGLRTHSQSQTPATNLHLESVSRTLNGTVGSCQRSSIAEYGSLLQDIHQGDECISSQERSIAESVDVCQKALSQNPSLPTPHKAKHVEVKGSKRHYDHAMGLMQNSVARWPLLQQIAQSQDVERQNSSTCAKHLDAAKKIKIQKAVQENLHGVAPEVIDIEDDPTDGARKDESTASINRIASDEKCGVPKTPGRKGPRGRKKSVPPAANASEIPCLVKNSADIEKCIVPKTPAKKGPRGRKKTVPPPVHASEIQVYEPTPAKTPSSRSHAKEKGFKSKQDSGKARGPSGELLGEDLIAEIIYRLQNLCLGDKSREQEQNALVLYKENGTVVPYENKKRKPRPKVDIDDETMRIWNLLMGKAENEGEEEMDKKKEKWWEEERNVFRGRVDSFIARMHLVQGDRRFSPWKGSVVDSVVGVFLTQNVSDHLSSSAFMSLAARFPPKSPKPPKSSRSVVVEDPEGSILDLHDDEICLQGNEGLVLREGSGDVQKQKTAIVAQKKPDMNTDIVDIEDFGMNFRPTNFTMVREMKGTLAAGKKPTSHWDSLRRDVLENEGKKERSKDSMDSIDYEAVRRATINEISDAIKERGMNNMLAVRIKDFLERIVKDHGAVDLEWLRDVHPDKAKDYLLSIRGLGLKSVECVRLLTLHNLAFPVDTNVGRIAVRLGWVPLQPLPESLQLHLLEL